MRLFNPASNVLTTVTDVVLRRGAAEQERGIRGMRPHKGCTLLTLAGCESMTAAEELVGWEVCVRETQLPPAAPGEAYHYQLLGMTVVTLDGVEIGDVAEVLTTAANDICVVRQGTREYLIPFIADVVREVDRDRRRLVIDPLPGLLEL